MGAHKATLEEDAGIQRTNPRHRRSTRQRRANGVIPSLTRLSSAGGTDYMAGKMGSPKGKVGSQPLFSFVFVLSLSLTHTPHTQNSVVQIAFPLLYLPYYISFLYLSLGSPTLPSSTPLNLLWDLWRSQPCLTRDAKTGDTPGQRIWAMNSVPPHPCPSRWLYYLIRSSS